MDDKACQINMNLWWIDNWLKHIGADISDSEIACALSHALLYKEIVDKKTPHSIILEDDCIIDNDFAKLVKRNYLQNSNCKGVLLYHLSASVIKLFSKPLFGEYQIHKIAKTPFAAVGYYLTLPMAEKLLNSSLPVCNHADWHCDIARNWNGSNCSTHCKTPANSKFLSRKKSNFTKK